MRFNDPGILRSVYFLVVMATLFIATISRADENPLASALPSLKNFQQNTTALVSAGLPERTDFELLRKHGVGRVIDLIPGDRSDERALVQSLGMEYFNVQVEWENPTLQNFKDYVHYMNVPGNKGDKTLTHCKLNWRGSAFVYLYRVTQLNEPEAVAKADMDKIWQPDDTWQAFINEVKSEYNE